MGADRVALGKVLFGAKSITSGQLVCFALGHTAARLGLIFCLRAVVAAC